MRAHFGSKMGKTPQKYAPITYQNGVYGLYGAIQWQHLVVNISRKFLIISEKHRIWRSVIVIFSWGRTYTAM